MSHLNGYHRWIQAADPDPQHRPQGNGAVVARLRTNQPSYGLENPVNQRRRLRHIHTELYRLLGHVFLGPLETSGRTASTTSGTGGARKPRTTGDRSAEGAAQPTTCGSKPHHRSEEQLILAGLVEHLDLPNPHIIGAGILAERA